MDKKSIWIISGLVVVLIVVLVVGYFMGWFSKNLKLVDGDGVVDRLSSGAVDESRYSSIAKSVKDSLSGLNYQSSFFESIADQLLSLNKNELRLVSNIYNRDFGDSDYPTIRMRIGSEMVGASWAFGGLVPTPCTQAEKDISNSICYKQALVLRRLNEINA